nr:unnamed protein product [Naegleria fowleri]
MPKTKKSRSRKSVNDDDDDSEEPLHEFETSSIDSSENSNDNDMEEGSDESNSISWRDRLKPSVSSPSSKNSKKRGKLEKNKGSSSSLSVKKKKPARKKKKVSSSSLTEISPPFVDFTTTDDFNDSLPDAVYFSRLVLDKLTMEEVRDLPIQYSIEFPEDYLAVRNVILFMWWNDIATWINCDTLLEQIPNLAYIKKKTIVSPSLLSEIIVVAYEFLNRHGFINYGYMCSTRYPKPVDTSLKPHHFELLKRTPILNKEHKHVVVIGAGISGILAAKKLLSLGYQVTIIEGRGRPGGRVFTDYSWTDHSPVDIGASIITNTSASPIVCLANQTLINLVTMPKEDQLFQSNGKKVPKDLDEKYTNLYNEILDRVCSLKFPEHEEERELYRRDPNLGFSDRHPKDLSYEARVNKTDMSLGYALDKMIDYYVSQVPEQDRKTMKEVLHWHAANLDYGKFIKTREYFNDIMILGVGHDVESASLYHWDQDDIYELGGDHSFVKEGFSKMIDMLCNDTQQLENNVIRFNQMVTEIDYSDPKIVKVKTKTTPKFESIHSNPIGEFKTYKPEKQPTNDTSQEFTYPCDAVLVTVPLGVLQGKSPSNVFNFNPPLPEWKTQAIHKLGFGLLNKIILEFDYEFWEKSHFFFGLTHDNPNERGFCYLFWNLYPLTQKPLLCGLVAGKSAFELENDANNLEFIKSKVMKYLRKAYHWSTELPDPKKILRTNWYSDPMSTGSYSYVRIGATGDDYDLLAESVEDRIFFAGEHTSRKFPATVMGAAVSGLREAAKIDAHFANLSTCNNRLTRLKQSNGTNVSSGSASKDLTNNGHCSKPVSTNHSRNESNHTTSTTSSSNNITSTTTTTTSTTSTVSSESSLLASMVKKSNVLTIQPSSSSQSRGWRRTAMTPSLHSQQNEVSKSSSHHLSPTTTGTTATTLHNTLIPVTPPSLHYAATTTTTLPPPHSTTGIMYHGVAPPQVGGTIYAKSTPIPPPPPRSAGGFYALYHAPQPTPPSSTHHPTTTLMTPTLYAYPPFAVVNTQPTDKNPLDDVKRNHHSNVTREKANQ